MEKKLVLVVMFVLLLSLIGCNNTNNVGINNVLENNIVENDNSEILEYYPLIIIDGKEREVVIESKPQRIISIAPNITEIIYILDLGDLLVGRTDYCNYPEEVLEVDSIGSLTEPNIESIIALNPDLVIASTHFSKEALEKLEEVGINVLILFEQESFDGVYEVILQIGQIFNVTENSNVVIENMKSDVKEVIEVLDGVEKKSVYYVVDFGEYGDYTATGDTFIHEMLEMAGGLNIAADATAWSYNLESLLEKDPEYIICSENWDTKVNFESTEGYNSLTAVSNNKVLEINQDLLSRQGPRLAEALKVIAKLLHPELFN